ncbi:MAG TPA: pectate lyase, partial [Candidatus Limnocylindrales bacterium]|nr:pectate lyase [Candidatus Limnocylindrales bacterium]
GPLQGAIYQYGHGGQPVEWFFPYYIARCVPALAEAYRFTNDERFRDGAVRALEFILRGRYEDGSFPQVIYSPKRVNRYPQWIAGTGDILRAITVGVQLGMSIDPEPTERWMLAGRQTNGSIRTAHGFAAQMSQKLRGSLPEFRDVLPVCGWADKTFRYMAESLESGGMIPMLSATQLLEVECTLRGVHCLYRETDQAMELWNSTTLLYRWRKGEMWAEVNTHDLLWK